MRLMHFVWPMCESTWQMCLHFISAMRCCNRVNKRLHFKFQRWSRCGFAEVPCVWDVLDENVAFKKYTSSFLLMLVCWRIREDSQSVVPGKVYEADVGWNKRLSWAWLRVPTLKQASHMLPVLVLQSFEPYRNWEESDVADCQTCRSANGVNLLP